MIGSIKEDKEKIEKDQEKIEEEEILMPSFWWSKLKIIMLKSLLKKSWFLFSSFRKNPY